MTKHKIITNLFIGIIGLFLISISTTVLASSLQVKSTLVGENKIKTNKMQLIEGVIHNKGNRDVAVTAKLRITLPNGKSYFHSSKRVTALNNSETRVLFKYWINKWRGGKYKASVYLYDSRGHILAKTNSNRPGTFVAKAPPKALRRVGKGKAAEIAKKARIVSLQQQAVFDPPDLSWSRVQIVKNSVLRGESSIVKVGLTNQGGDIAKNVKVSLYWIFSRRANKGTTPPFFQKTISFVAPGENKILEVPFAIPENELRGKYKVLALVDEDNLIKEENETNNTLESENQLSFEDVGLLFPTEGEALAEGGLFLFQWKSNKYNQFKVQVSADPEFTDPELRFEMPKDDPTSKMELSPLIGEIPTMAINMMKKAKTDKLYWRVIGLDNAGQRTESDIRSFYINIKPQ